jgi:hypothetical protein
MAGVVGALLEIKDMICINRFSARPFTFWPFFCGLLEEKNHITQILENTNI